MKLKTAHRKVIVGSTQYEFTPFQNYFVGEVPDEVGNFLLSIKRNPEEYRLLQEETDKVAEVKPDVKPAVVKEGKVPVVESAPVESPAVKKEEPLKKEVKEEPKPEAKAADKKK